MGASSATRAHQRVHDVAEALDASHDPNSDGGQHSGPMIPLRPAPLRPRPRVPQQPASPADSGPDEEAAGAGGGTAEDGDSAAVLGSRSAGGAPRPRCFTSSAAGYPSDLEGAVQAAPPRRRRRLLAFSDPSPPRSAAPSDPTFWTRSSVAPAHARLSRGRRAPAALSLNASSADRPDNSNPLDPDAAGSDGGGDVLCPPPG